MQKCDTAGRLLWGRWRPLLAAKKDRGVNSERSVRLEGERGLAELWEIFKTDVENILSVSNCFSKNVKEKDFSLRFETLKYYVVF